MNADTKAPSFAPSAPSDLELRKNRNCAKEGFMEVRGYASRTKLWKRKGSTYWYYSFRINQTQYSGSCRTRDEHAAILYAERKWQELTELKKSAVCKTIPLTKLCAETEAI